MKPRYFRMIGADTGIIRLTGKAPIPANLEEISEAEYLKTKAINDAQLLEAQKARAVDRQEVLDKLALATGLSMDDINLLLGSR